MEVTPCPDEMNSERAKRGQMTNQRAESSHMANERVTNLRHWCHKRHVLYSRVWVR